MALAFKTFTVTIPQTTGRFTTHEDTSFGRSVQTADVAIKSFKLDYIGDAGPSNIVQVGTALEDIGEESIEFSVMSNYSAGMYTGEISVLIIAELR
jgi:hypothetical protein